MKIKVVNKSGNRLPAYETIGAAGMDLRAWIEPESIILKPLERKLISTGLHIELPPNVMAEIRPRSGLAINKGITIINSPGTIESDYRGEIFVALVNLSCDDFIIKNGDRIAQMVLVEIVKVELTEPSNL